MMNVQLPSPCCRVIVRSQELATRTVCPIVRLFLEDDTSHRIYIPIGKSDARAIDKVGNLDIFQNPESFHEVNEIMLNKLNAVQRKLSFQPQQVDWGI
jgi:hypothetical protein